MRHSWAINSEFLHQECFHISGFLLNASLWSHKNIQNLIIHRLLRYKSPACNTLLHWAVILWICLCHIKTILHGFFYDTRKFYLIALVIALWLLFIMPEKGYYVCWAGRLNKISSLIYTSKYPSDNSQDIAYVPCWNWPEQSL